MLNDILRKICEKAAPLIPDKTTRHFYRPDYQGYLEGSGYALPAPAANAAWRVGTAKRALLPHVAMGAVYVAGSDGKARRLQDVPVRQFIRAAALDDGSDRGIHVFVSLECAGLSHSEVRRIRQSLADLTTERNVVTLHVAATGDPGGADTLGLWGDGKKAALRNLPRLLSKKTAENADSGRNADVMEYLRFSAAQCVREAAAAMTDGALFTASAADGIRFKWQPASGDARYAAVKNGVLRMSDAPFEAQTDWVPAAPLLNVFTEQLLIPADNAALLLAAKLKLTEPDMVRFENGDGAEDYYYETEAGVVQIGETVTIGMIPTDAAGFGLTEAARLRPGMTVAGLVSDALGVRRQKDKLNGLWTRLPADAGRRAGTEINGALARAAKKL